MRFHHPLVLLFLSSCTTSTSTDIGLVASIQGPAGMSLPVLVDTGLVEVDSLRITVISTLVPPKPEEIGPPLVLNQHVTFYISDSQTAMFDFAVERDDILYNESFRVSALSIYLNEIGILPGKHQYLMVLHGYGGCDGCKVYTAIMNTSGETLYSQLRDKVNVYEESGDFRKVVHRAGFPLQDYLAYRYTTTSLPGIP